MSYIGKAPANSALTADDITDGIIGADKLASNSVTSSKLDQNGGFTFNEDSASVDFRVESNGDANCLIVDGSGDKVGIGEDVPEGKLHVFTGDASVGPNAKADELIVEGSGHSGISILSGNSSHGSIMFGDNGDDDIGQIRYDHSNNTMSFIANTGNAKLSLNSNSVNTFVNLNVNGTLAKDSGSFRISHPLESKKDTHYLIHSFVESPQANNIYRGKVDLVDGTATVNLDTVSTMTSGTFTALNREIHVYTTNESDWNAVKGSVSGNTLTINCQNASSTATVSWLVIGERQDQHMIDTDWTDSNGKVIVEREKG